MQDAAQHPLYAANHQTAAYRALKPPGTQPAAYNGSNRSRQDGQQEQQLILFERKNRSLRQERDKALNDAISPSCKAQYSDLHHVASTIYIKLDDSIKQLTELIEQ